MNHAYAHFPTRVAEDRIDATLRKLVRTRLLDTLTLQADSKGWSLLYPKTAGYGLEIFWDEDRPNTLLLARTSRAKWTWWLLAAVEFVLATEFDATIEDDGVGEIPLAELTKYATQRFYEYQDEDAARIPFPLRFFIASETPEELKVL